MEKIVFEYGIYDYEGLFTEQCVPFDDFDVIVENFFYCFENDYNFTIAPNRAINGFLPTIQIIQSSDENGDPRLMLLFETNNQNQEELSATFVKYYNVPFTEEKIKDILEYLYAFSMKQLMPDISQEDWEDVTEREESFMPQIISYYLDDLNRPICKDSKDNYYFMFKGKSFDEFAFKFSQDVEIDEKKLRKVKDVDAKIRADYVYGIDGNLYTFWFDKNHIYALDYCSKIFDVVLENKNSISFKESLIISVDFKWENISLERVLYYLNNQ